MARRSSACKLTSVPDAPVDRELVLFCDESDKDGRFYSNIYGGVLVGSSQIDRIRAQLEATKADLNIHGEVKWSKTSAAYLGKYQQLISTFFDEVRDGHLKVRIMFRQNATQAPDLTAEQREMGYFLLYYQFIKHAFGLRHMPFGTHDVHLRLYFDEFPDNRDRIERFKGFLYGLQMDEKLQERGVHVRIADIAEVRSHDHILLQCLDVILGAMTFRLNDKHLEKPEGHRTRGKRTIAKEKLYRHILSEIRTIRPNFNIGISTGMDLGVASTWHDHYRHWKFVPTGSEFDRSQTKRHGDGQ